MRLGGLLTLLFFVVHNLAKIEPTRDLLGLDYHSKDENGVREKSNAIDQSDRRLERTDDSNPPHKAWDPHLEGQDSVDSMIQVGVYIGYVLLGLLVTVMVIGGTFAAPFTHVNEEDQDQYDSVTEPEESDTDLMMNYQDGDEFESHLHLSELFPGTCVPRLSDTDIKKNFSSLGRELVHMPELQKEIVHFDFENPVTLPYVPKEPIVRSPRRRAWTSNRSCSIDSIRSRSRTKSESVRSWSPSSNDGRFNVDEQLLNSSVKSPLEKKQGSMDDYRLHRKDTARQKAVNHRHKSLEPKQGFFFKRGIGKKGSEERILSIPSETTKLLPSSRSASPPPSSRNPQEVKDKVQWSLTTLPWPSVFGKNNELSLGKSSRNKVAISRVDGEARYESLPQSGEPNQFEDIKQKGKHTEVIDTLRLLTNETLNISTNTSAPESLSLGDDGSPKHEENKQPSLDKEREINQRRKKVKG